MATCSCILAFFYTVLAASLQTCLSQAPGDEDASCLVGENTKSYPAEWRVLLDSHNYESLLEGSDPAWQTLDADGQGQGWKQRSDECQRTTEVCDYVSGPNQQNWLFTQYIPYKTAKEVLVQLTYNFETCLDQPTCVIYFLQAYVYETNGSSALQGMRTNITNYRPIARLEAPQSNSNINTITFQRSVGSNGFYLAIEDTGTCGVIERMIVYYTVCLENTDGLVTFPEVPHESESEPASVEPICGLNSEPVSHLLCYSNGTYTAERSPACACSPGYVLENNGSVVHCIACSSMSFKPGASNTKPCSLCPANSRSISIGSDMCLCDPGYFRTAENNPYHSCLRLGAPYFSDTSPPSSNTTSATIFWSPFPVVLSHTLLYNVYLKGPHEDTYVKWEKKFAGAADGVMTVISTTLNNLTSGTTYFVTIVASNDELPDYLNTSSLNEYRSRAATSHITTNPESSVMSFQNEKETGYLTAFIVAVVIAVCAVIAVVILIYKYKTRKMALMVIASNGTGNDLELNATSESQVVSASTHDITSSTIIVQIDDGTNDELPTTVGSQQSIHEHQVASASHSTPVGSTDHLDRGVDTTTAQHQQCTQPIHQELQTTTTASCSDKRLSSAAKRQQSKDSTASGIGLCRFL